MDVVTEMHGETVVHRVSGWIDTGTAADAERKLTAEVRQGRRVVLDMTQVAYVSSAGLRVVLMAAKLAKANRGAVSLFGLSTAVEIQASVAEQKQATHSRRDALHPGPRSGAWMQGAPAKSVRVG